MPWEAAHASGAWPCARWGAAHCPDGKGGAFQFGGAGELGRLRDLWRLMVTSDGQGWIERRPVTECASWPRARECASMALSTRREGAQLWLYGGGAGDDSKETGLVPDLWMYNVSSKAWTKIAQKGSCPGARLGHCAVASSKVMLLFGGVAAREGRPVVSNDIFSFTFTTQNWRRRTAQGAAPSPRAFAACAALDSKCRAVALYGGEGTGGQVLGDLHLLHADSMIWRRVELPGDSPPPPPRSLASLAVADRRGALLMCGGAASGDEGVMADGSGSEGAGSGGGLLQMWRCELQGDIDGRETDNGRRKRGQTAPAPKGPVFGRWQCLDGGSAMPAARYGALLAPADPTGGDYAPNGSALLFGGSCLPSLLPVGGLYKWRVGAGGGGADGGQQVAVRPPPRRAQDKPDEATAMNVDRHSPKVGDAFVANLGVPCAAGVTIRATLQPTDGKSLVLGGVLFAARAN